MMGLQWTALHLDGAAPRIDVLRSYRGLPKSKKKRHVPLHPELARIRRVWRDRKVTSKENLAFPTERGKMGRGADDYELRALLTAANCHLPGEAMARAAPLVRLTLHHVGWQHPDPAEATRPLGHQADDGLRATSVPTTSPPRSRACRSRHRRLLVRGDSAVFALRLGLKLGRVRSGREVVGVCRVIGIRGNADADGRTR